MGGGIDARREYCKALLCGLAVSLSFLALGVYAMVSSAGQGPFSRLFLAGASLFVIGLISVWRLVVPLAMPLRQTFQSKAEFCPFCGAVLGSDDAFCEKCKRLLSAKRQAANG